MSAGLSVTELRKSRADLMRKARNAKFYADSTTGETRRVWVAHLRSHVTSARLDNRLLVCRLREWSRASIYTRRTVPFHTLARA